MTEGAPVAWAVADLHEIVDTGLMRGGDLLTDEELAVCRKIRALSGPAALAYARLSGRKGTVFVVEDLALAGVDDVEGAVEALVTEGLLASDVPWDVRAAYATVDALKAGCRRLGLPLGGRRDLLVARLIGREGWDDRRWVRVVHRRLLDRLARWTFLRLEPDRSGPVLERMGVITWPVYTPTPGGFFRDRAVMLDWEAAVEAAIAGTDAATSLAWLDRRAVWPEGGLSPARRFVETVLIEAQAREQAGDPSGARSLYDALVERGRPAPTLAFRVARTYEAEGRPLDALAALRAARPASDPVERLQITRAERRLARATRTGYAPEIPLRTPATRTVRLVAAGGDGARPLWTVGGESLPIEAAVVRLLAAAGREALHGEGTLWTTLFGLLFADTYFLPVPGMLPARRLSGPLDVGRRAYAVRRAEAVAEVREALRRGEGPGRIEQAAMKRARQALAGVSWPLAPVERLVRIARDVGPAVLDAVMGRLLEEGWSVSAGLPDLLVLAGPEVRLNGHPSRVQPGALFVEIKGPTDSVRDAQVVWFDRLVAAGARVERWDVVAPECVTFK